MNKYFLHLAAIATTLVLLVSCGNSEIDDPITTVPESFPRKQLVEQFTSQSCGYCPQGIAYIEEALDGKSNYVWVSNHSGFADDDFTISESKTLASNFSINSAPSLMLNRETLEIPEEGSKRVFHPYYLKDLFPAEQSTANSSVVISNEYDATTRELKVTVSGQCANPDVTRMRLTVLIKESGMVALQSDFVFTFEGWQEYIHTHAVRAFLTATLGDEVTLDKQQYSATFTTKLGNNWEADNCMVVAFLTTVKSGVVVNAEEVPVVNGTKGGADIIGGGKTPVPVSDSYPEVGTAKAELSYDEANWGIDAQLDNYNIFRLQLSGVSHPFNGRKFFPVALFYIAAQGETLPYGTYPLVSIDKLENGTALQGYRLETPQQQTLDGSMLYYIDAAYYKATGNMQYTALYLLHEGSITISEEGISYDATTLNGSHTTGTFVGTMEKAQVRAKINRKQ